MINVKYILMLNGIMKVPDLHNTVNYITEPIIIVGKKTTHVRVIGLNLFFILFFMRVTFT